MRASPSIQACLRGLLCGAVLAVAMTTPAGAMGGVDDEKEPFISVPAFAKAHGFRKPVYTDASVSLSNRWNRITLNVDSRRAQINGVQLMLNQGVFKDDEGWRIDKTDVRKTLNPLLQPMEHLGGVNAGVIVLDPGHGGTDTGCHGSLNRHEKEIALEISRQVFLDLVLKGYQVLMTRTGDTALTLTERTDRAREWKADLFVSIHLNSSASGEARGPETYVLAVPGYHSTNATPEGEADGKVNVGNQFDDANIILGHAVHAELAREVRTDRGLRRARFQVLRDAPCPAVLVECGYLSNAEEEKRLVNPVTRDRIAASISRGIDAYCGQVRRGNLVAGPRAPAPKAAPAVAANPGRIPPASALPMPAAPVPPVLRGTHGSPSPAAAPVVSIPSDALHVPSIPRPRPAPVPAPAAASGLPEPLPMPPRSDRPHVLP
jgi:N-acetylmuramoyl-L-alanine amidase